MRTATIISLVFHVGVFLFAWLGLPTPKSELVPMQVIDVAFESEVAKPEPEPEPEPAPKPALKPPPPPPPAPEPPQPVAAPEPEPEPEPEVEPEPEPEPLPEPPVAEKPAPVPEAKPEPKPEPPKVVQAPRPKNKPKPPPRAERPPEPEPKPKPKPKDNFASVLKTVSKLEKSAPKQETKPEKTLQQQVAEALSRKQAPAPRIDTVISASDLDAIRRQIEACWNLPAGARDAQNMTVEIRTLMNPDGRVRSAMIVDTARAASDSFYRSMAESALRAVLNPKCQPFRLPVEKYDEWRVMVLNFDPRGMY